MSRDATPGSIELFGGVCVESTAPVRVANPVTVLAYLLRALVLAYSYTIHRALFIPNSYGSTPYLVWQPLARLMTSPASSP